MLDYREMNDLQEFGYRPSSRDIFSDVQQEVQDIPDDIEGYYAEEYQDVQQEVQDIPDDMEGYYAEEYLMPENEIQDIPEDIIGDEPDYWEMAAPTPVSEMHEPEPDVNIPGSQVAKDVEVGAPGETFNEEQDMGVPREDFQEEEDMDVPGSQVDTDEDMDAPGAHYETKEQQEGNDCRDISEIMEAFQSENWEGLSDDARKEAIDELSEYVAQDLNIKDKPKIEFYNNEDSGDFGSYSPYENTIYINEFNMDNAVETADTITHETRHCYQHECADHPKTEQDYAFRDNFDNYVTPDMDFEGYEDQIVEADARDYAQAYRDMIS